MLCHILLLNYGGEFQLISVLKKNSNILSFKKKLRCFLIQKNHYKPFPNQTSLDYLVLHLCPRSRGSQEISTREAENPNSSLVCISQNHSFVSPKETPILLQNFSKYYKKINKSLLFLTQMSKNKMKSGSENEVAQLCPTICNPMDCSLPGFSIHGIFQARILERVAISFSMGSS